MTQFAYWLLSAATISELCVSLFLPRLNSQSVKVISVMIAVSSTIATSIFLASELTLLTLLLAVLAIFRTLNVNRLITARMHAYELRTRATRTAAVVGLMTAVVVALQLGEFELHRQTELLMYTQLIAAVVLMTSVVFSRSFYRYRPRKTDTKHVPTVTVCIPARNETEDLPGCIESVLASTYPKLEILVLDDCSQDKTPQIIKSYAHAGVRFIKGKVPDEDWLAKNAAYDRLADEAQGEVLLFMGVDVRMEPHTVNELVAQLGESGMLSVLPKRSIESEGAFFIQPIRYWWELGLWRYTAATPPVLSTCWLVRRSELDAFGGFNGIKKAVEPEAVFARRFARESRYSFLVANKMVGLTSNKNSHAQFRTALRMRYPQLKRRPESLLLLVLAESVLLVAPFVLLAHSVIFFDMLRFVVSLVTVCVLSAANTEVYKLALRRLWPLGFFTFPALVVVDWVLLVRSLYAYEFGEVIWKERNICIPLLKVEKSLPKLDE